MILDSGLTLLQYTLRRAYYAKSEDLQDFDLGIDRDAHVGHCFDYLRQSITCLADSSVEPAVGRVVGNAAWGFDRQCRDFGEVKSWAEAQRLFDAHGFIASESLQSKKGNNSM